MDLTLMAANQVGVNIIRNITDAEIASIEAKGEIQRSKMRMAHLDEMEAIEKQGKINNKFRNNINIYIDDIDDIKNNTDESKKYYIVKRRNHLKFYHLNSEVYERVKNMTQKMKATLKKSIDRTLENDQKISYSKGMITNMLNFSENKGLKNDK